MESGPRGRRERLDGGTHSDARAKGRSTLNQPRTILLTGATGALGEALVERLARHRLTCLVHRARPERDDVEVVHGDLAEERLGLPEERYDELARSVDCVVHAGAVTDPFTAVGRIHETNIEGTRRIVELARASGAQLVHVSTAFVGKGEQAVDAAAADDDRRDPHAGTKAYATSKRIAEALLADSGVPHVVVRTSIVAGDAGTGEIGKFQGLHTVIGLIVEGKLPMLPVEPERRVDFLPRDLVADAVCSLIDGGVREGSVWLTAGERALTVRDVVEAAAAFGRELGNESPVPRFIEPDALDRLIRPVFLSQLPADVTEELERLFALFSLVDAPEPFPSSLDELGIEAPDLAAVLEANLRFWATSELKPAEGSIPEQATDLERWLVDELTARLPDAGAVDAESAFADIGLDSVEAAGIAEEMEAAFGCKVAVKSFYDHRNARELARFLARDGGDGDSASDGAIPAIGAAPARQARGAGGGEGAWAS